MSALLVMPAAEYHAMPELNAGRIIRWINHSEAAWQEIEASPTTETDPMRLGTAIHSLVLEPGEASAVCYSGRRAGGDWRMFQADHHGYTILKPLDFDRAIACHKAVLNSRHYAKLDPASNICERVVLWEHNGVALRSRVDAFSSDLVVDLKTWGGQGRLETKAIYDGWVYQMAIYQRALHALDGKLRTARIVVAPTKMPFSEVRCLMFDQDVLDEAWRRAEVAIDEIGESLKVDWDQGYAPDEMPDIEIPMPYQWAKDLAVLDPVHLDLGDGKEFTL